MQAICSLPRPVAITNKMPIKPQPHRSLIAHSASADTITTTKESTDVKLSGPEPQRFAVKAGEEKNIASAAFCTVARAGAGVFALGYKATFVRETPENKGEYALLKDLPLGLRTKESSRIASFPRPSEPLIVYDAQDCPNSRKIREAVCILDLVTLFKPCPEGATTWRKELQERQNTSSTAPTLPYLIDPNHGIELSDADEIVAYLFRNYGNNRPPLVLQKGPINDLTAKIGMAPRKDIGATYTPSKKPEKPLKYYAYEGSPFCVVVREALSELELQHELLPCARGSPRRQQVYDRHSHFQVPYLEDPNTGVAMFESSAIIEYLRKTYGA